jgi:hypothetical protein
MTDTERRIPDPTPEPDEEPAHDGAEGDGDDRLGERHDDA